MGNLKARIKKVCVIGDSQWGRKLMDVAYGMGALGGVVESNLKKFTVLFESYPGIVLYTHIERAVNEGHDCYVVDVAGENKFDIVRKLLNNKKNIFIKKMFAKAPRDISELIEISKSTGAKIMLGNTLQFYQVVEKVKDTILKEQIGEIEGIFSYRYNNENSMQDSWDNSFLFSIKEENILINQLKQLNGNLLRNIHSCRSIDSSQSHKNIPAINQMIKESYLNTKSSNNLLQQFFISFRINFSNFRIFIIGNKGLIIIEDINGNYKLTTFSQKNNRLAYRIWMPDKETKDVDCLLKEELQVFLAL